MSYAFAEENLLYPLRKELQKSKLALEDCEGEFKEVQAEAKEVATRLGLLRHIDLDNEDWPFCSVIDWCKKCTEMSAIIDDYHYQRHMRYQMMDHVRDLDAALRMLDKFKQVQRRLQPVLGSRMPFLVAS